MSSEDRSSEDRSSGGQYIEFDYLIGGWPGHFQFQLQNGERPGDYH
jgi:hypothetical protein